MKQLTIQIECEEISDFDYQLDRIKSAIENGRLNGEEWNISEIA